jgi:hypothetical protein
MRMLKGFLVGNYKFINKTAIIGIYSKPACFLTIYLEQ